jgi:phage terminase large subunit-like protein
MILDRWQRDLIRHVLELYPEGHEKAGQLRYRECFVSVGRQNGKSVIGSILAVYGLLREKGALVIGLASSAEQARIVYDRLLRIIKADPRLAKRFVKVTDTRGIGTHTGSRYEIKAAKSAAVQGLATSIGIIDELHITKPALWTDLVNGIAAKPRGLVFGITTAGDEQSDLLKSLYERAEKGSERFGYFIWEAPSAYIPSSDAELALFLSLANPSVAEGRRPVADEIASVRSMAGGTEGEADLIHYRLNRFVASLNPFLPGEKWNACAKSGSYTFPTSGPLVFAFDVSPDDAYASVTAHRRTPDGIHHTELVAWFVYPKHETLIRTAETLFTHAPSKFAMDGMKLRAVGKELIARGYPVHIGTKADAFNSASLLYMKVMQGEIVHANDPLLSMQMPRTVRKTTADVYRIDKANSTVAIDAVMATALGTLVLEQTEDFHLGVF